MVEVGDFMPVLCIQPTYEELKQSKLSLDVASVRVSSLPMRN